MKKYLRAFVTLLCVFALSATALAAEIPSDETPETDDVIYDTPVKFPEPEYGPCEACQKHWHELEQIQPEMEPEQGLPPTASAIEAELPPTASADEYETFLCEPPLALTIPVSPDESEMPNEDDKWYEEPGAPDDELDEPGAPADELVIYYSDGSMESDVESFLDEYPVLGWALEDCGSDTDRIYISEDRYEAYFLDIDDGTGFYVYNWDVNKYGNHLDDFDFLLEYIPTAPRFPGVMRDTVYLAVYAWEAVRYTCDFNGNHYVFWAFPDEVEECLEYAGLSLYKWSDFMPFALQDAPIDIESELVEVLPIP